ncbi:MAG TPA: peptide-methionine (R)-S-oxide reductase MsrB [bacterium]|nr:peptide-methionine (R)-S-oxide reductase MsrB [bacterium]
MDRKIVAGSLVLGLLALLPGGSEAKAKAKEKIGIKGCYMGKWKGDKVVKTDAEWKKALTPEQYEILRGHGTERACTGLYWNNHEKGVYHCAGCGLEIFVSDTKFESGTGWPSFFKPIYPENIATREDHSWGMDRVEIHCPRCGGHLGHVFEDGPPPTGLRYCVNSASVTFVPDSPAKK